MKYRITVKNNPDTIDSMRYEAMAEPLGWSWRYKPKMWAWAGTAEEATEAVKRKLNTKTVHTEEFEV